MIHDGFDILNEDSHQLTQLVAKSAVWAPKEVVAKLFQEEDNSTASWYINVRRRLSTERKRAEKFIDGTLLDNNNYANYAIKKAMGITTKNYTVCHIYPNSVYDCRYFTSIPNLVLLPSPIASLSDHHADTIGFLKYYSYMEYGFYINEVPIKPEIWDKIDVYPKLKIGEDQIASAMKGISRRKRIRTEKDVPLSEK